MSTPDDDVVRPFREAYSVLLERTPDAPTFEEITSRTSQERGVDACTEIVDDFEVHRDRAVARRPIGLALVAAAVIVAVMGLVAANRDGSDIRTTTTASSNAERSASGWSLVFRGDLANLDEDDIEVSGVVAGGPGFVAVGGHGEHAAVWTSIDGLTWTRVPHDDSVFGDQTQINDVAPGGPGLVAVGSVCNAGTNAGGECVDGDAAVWTSIDGLTWTRVPHDDEAGDGLLSFEMNSITSGGPGLVAVGTSWEFEEPEGALERNLVDSDAAVWTSVDGLTWTQVPHDEAVFGGERHQSMGDVTVGGPGLVAVGRDGLGVAWDNDPSQAAVVWTSVDGLTWSRVSHDEAVFGGDGPAMLSVAAGGPGLVAVGWSTPHDRPTAVWTSVDGLAWSRITHDDPVEMSGTMVSVTTGGPGLVAIGGQGEDAMAWTSPDGLTWSAATTVDPGATPAWWTLDVVADGERLVGPGVVIERTD